MKYLLRNLVFFGCCLVMGLFSFISADAQSVLTGKIYDGETESTLEGVSVRNKARSTGELSDRYGFYSINAVKGDSIEFYMVGYGRFYVVYDGPAEQKKLVFLHVEKFNLPEVQVLAHKNSKKDSLLNREENAAIFNYRRPSAASTIIGSLFHPTTGIEYLVNSAKRKRLRNFQAHLEEDERDRYIDSKYTRQEIADITGLTGEDLETFKRLYRPSFEDMHRYTEYDVLEYIKNSYKDFVEYRKKNPDSSKIKAAPSSSSKPKTK